MASPNDIIAAFRGRVGFEALSVEPGDNQIRMIGRIPPNGQAQWVLLIHHMLVQSAQMPWKADISRYYFLRASANNRPRLFYSWRIIFQAKGIAGHLKSIIDTINNAARPSRVELQEFPLTGTKRNYANGKGAFTAESSPLAITRGGGSRG